MKKYGKGLLAEEKKKLTNQEKAQLIAKQKFEEIANQIEEGTVSVSRKKRIISDPRKDQGDDPLTLEGIDESLRLMRENIQEQKREHKQAQKLKRLKAQQLIVKIKKDKEEHKQKLHHFEEEKNVLSSRIFSESTIGKMRQKLEERITNKRKEIQERIKNIAIRQGQRENRSVDQQIKYWDRVKKINNKSQSTKQLPSIANPEQVERKNSVTSLPRKGSLSHIKTEVQQDKKIEIYIEKAKIRQQHGGINMNLMQRKNEQRLNRIIDSNKLLASKLGGGDRNDQNQFIPYNANKSKLHGNQYLKDSLLKIKRNLSPTSSQVQTDKMSQHESMELKAHEKYINRNDQVEKLKENWDRMLSRIKHNEVTQEQGLDILNSLERRLDKIDFEGMRDRLKRKFEVLEERSKQNEKESQLLSVQSN